MVSKYSIFWIAGGIIGCVVVLWLLDSESLKLTIPLIVGFCMGTIGMILHGW